jgi:poly(A) polymerase
MTPPDTISPGWLSAAPTRAVMSALEAARPDGARFVGGCVRNTLRNLPSDDVDIATQLTPGAVQHALEQAGLRVIDTGLAHGTLTAIADGITFEITTLRRDVATDGRRAVIAFTEDWAEDAARRDFRMNAIYADTYGALFEPIPGSIADAVAGRVIFIGDGDARLREDYLRILRFFRFNACARQRQGLAQISAERCWKEMKRLLAAPDPAQAIGAMERVDILAQIVPGASAGGLPALVQTETAAGLAPDPVRRLMNLMPRRVRDLAPLSDGLRLSNAETFRLAAWADAALPPVLGAHPASLRRSLYAHGAAAVTDRAVLEAAASANPAGLVSVLAITAGYQRPVLPVNGDDALVAGLSGPAIGAALHLAETAWIESDFSLDRAALLARLTPPGSVTRSPH